MLVKVTVAFEMGWPVAVTAFPVTVKSPLWAKATVNAATIAIEAQQTLVFFIQLVLLWGFISKPEIMVPLYLD
jgi:hypothetical protein